jgi:periplasmic protein CpxP/Spy
MKKLFFACSLFAAAFMFAPAMAQNTPPPAQAAPGGPAQRPMLTPDQRAEKRTEMMQKNLGLSDDQVTKVKQINLDFENQKDGILKNTTDPQQRNTQMKALRDKQNTDLKAVLTPDQWTKMQSMQGRPHPAGAPPTPPQPGNQ